MVLFITVAPATKRSERTTAAKLAKQRRSNLHLPNPNRSGVWRTRRDASAPPKSLSWRWRLVNDLHRQMRSLPPWRYLGMGMVHLHLHHYRRPRRVQVVVVVVIVRTRKNHPRPPPAPPPSSNAHQLPQQRRTAGLLLLQAAVVLVLPTLRRCRPEEWTIAAPIPRLLLPKLLHLLLLLLLLRRRLL